MVCTLRRFPCFRFLLAVVLCTWSATANRECLQSPTVDDATPCGFGAEVHVVAFDSNMRMNTVYLKVSAESSGFTNVVILGAGRVASWGNGMEHKINIYRSYVYEHTCGCDIVLLLDAGDVLVLGSPTEVEKRFHVLENKWNRSLFFGAEAECAQWEIPTCDQLEKITAGRGSWRFLNSGLIAGRSRALRIALSEPVTTQIRHDQEWFRLYFINHTSSAGIDYDTDLFLVAYSVDGAFLGGWSEEHGQPVGAISLTDGGVAPVVNKVTNTTPIILHFPGPGKWQAWLPKDESNSKRYVRGFGLWDDVWHAVRGDTESCAIHEVFLTLFPEAAKILSITRSNSDFISFMPGHRLPCVGFDDISPWRATSRLLETIRMLSWVAVLCGSLLCAVVLLHLVKLARWPRVQPKLHNV